MLRIGPFGAGSRASAYTSRVVKESERAIFDSAIELPPGERSAFVHGACSGDEQLEARLNRLIEAHVRAEEAASRLIPAAHALPDDPEWIDAYRILERIGEGGMGVVYMAEQSEPVRRRVALKIIKLGMDTKEVIARFESERQALALMNHPNIARILDAAATAEGRPYFVMEYVRGITITEYCDKMRLDIDQRLALFVDVCQAVQHAHQKGVVHRDIKPTNILVCEEEGRAVVKVIDFGVAKATDQRLTDKTLHTRFGFLIGTPQYMSPEQAEMTPLDVDTRSDVYSLGALLYELLTGVQPLDFDTKGAGPAELQAAIRDIVPAPPEARLRKLPRQELESIAASRSASPQTLARKLASELGWITAKALEKSPGRRYQAAQMLAEDVNRYLQHEPVLARVPSPFYRIGKFVRRHAIGVGMSVVAFTAIVGMTVFYTYQLALERDRANRQAETLAQVDRFLVDLFEVSDPGEARGETITAREVLDRGAERIADELRGQPEIQAKLMHTIGEIYVKLGLFDAARPLLQESLEMRRRAFGDVHEDVALSLDSLGYLLENMGDYDGAKPLLRESLAINMALFGERDAEVSVSLNNFALLLTRMGEFDEAERLHLQALDISRKVFGDEHKSVASDLMNLGFLYTAQGRLDEAERHSQEALDMQRRLLGDDHPDVLGALNNLASVMFYKGDYQAAEALFNETLTLQREVLGESHPTVVTTMNNLGVVRLRLKDFATAEPMFRESLRLRRQVLGNDHPDVASSIGNLARAIDGRGDAEAAWPLFEEAIALLRGSLGDDHWRVASVRTDYGASLAGLGQFDRAEAQLLDAHRNLEAGMGSDNERTREALTALVDLYDAWGRPEPAARYRSQLATDSTAEPDTP